MGYFGIPFRNGVPIGLGSVVSFGAQQFDPSELFVGGTVGAWYDPSDLSTLFTTSAGTTPVAMPGQGSAVSVGLMLDKSQNGVGTNGAKRVNLLTWTEDFSNAAWQKSSLVVSLPVTTASTISIPAIANAAHYSFIFNSTSAAVIGATYIFSVELKANTSGDIGKTIIIRIGIGAAAVNTLVTLTSIYTKYSVQIIAATTQIVTPAVGAFGSDFGGQNSAAVVADIRYADLRLASEANTAPTYQRIDANWYSTMAGNHAISFNDTTARPELRARVNLLTYSEQFDDGVWQVATVGSTNPVRTANQGIAPDGTNTADRIDFGAITNATDYSRLFQSFTSVATTYVGSVYLKAFSASDVGKKIFVWLFDSAGRDTQTVTLTDSWQRISSTSALTAGTSFITLQTAGSSVVTGGGAQAATSALVWGADLRPANIGANVPAYQRIADANTYDTSGFPLYLRFDGIDDSMYTPANLNLSGTDKVAVFAGARKLSDAAAGVVTELSADWNANSGTFFVSAPDNTGSLGNYGSGSRGTAVSASSLIARSATTLAPVTNVLTATHDILGDLSAIRLNGAASGTNATGDKGSGNFSTYPLFIGARNNSSLWFNGNIYSLIIAGSAVSAGNISATEQWVAGKTGIVIP